MERYCSRDHACHFKDFFEKDSSSQIGSGSSYSSYIPPFIGIQNQKGYGIGNLLGSLFRGALKLAKPLLRKAGVFGLKVLKREVKKRGVSAGKNAIKSILTGKSPKGAIKEEAKRQLSEIGSDALHFAEKKLNQVGNGRKRRVVEDEDELTSPMIKRKKLKVDLDDDIFS